MGIWVHSRCIQPVLVFLLVCCVLVLPVRSEDQPYPISVWPFFYHEGNQDKGQTDVMWPFYRHEWKSPWERYAFRPLIFSTESDSSRDFRKTSVLWPLNRYEREGDRLDMNLMLYWHGRDGSRAYTTVFPVYWEREGEDPTYLYLWPFYGKYCKGSYTEYSTCYPFFRYGSDPQDEEIDVHLFWPIMNYHRSPGYLLHRVLPFYEYEKGPDVSGGFIFPYYWRDAPDLHARGVIPLWYSSREPDAKTDAVFPLYFNRETDDGTLRLLLPLYGAWAERGASLQVILPVYYDYERDDFGLRSGFPVYWDYRDGPFSFTSIFPVYYRSRDAGLPSDFEYYFPVYGTYRIGDSYARHLLFMPLFSQYRDEALQVEGWDMLWPLLHYEKGPDRFSLRALPFLWKEDSPKSSLTVGFPFYFSYQDAGGSLYHVVPFYGKHTKGESYVQTFLLGPVYIATRDTENELERTDVLFPLFSSLRQGDTMRSWLFPLYYHREDAMSHMTFASPCLLPPYYYTDHEPNARRVHLWPFYHFSMQGDYSEYGTLWPLVRYGKDDAKEVTRSQILLFYHEKDHENAFSTVFPLWWHHSSPQNTSDATLLVHSYERDAEADETRFALIWILDRNYGVFTCRRQGDQNLEARFLYQVVSFERSGPDTREFRFLWRLVRKSSSPDREVLELNPFYYRETDRERTSYWAVLGGLIGCRTTSDGKRTMRYLWVF